LSECVPGRAFRAALLLVCSLSACVAARAQGAELRWGADPSGGAPYVYSDPAHPDTYIGYELEMVEALAAAMGRKPVFVPTDWETIVTSLRRGEFDVVVNGL
jgi:polar amino acid transport system substrate-binding protein